MRRDAQFVIQGGDLREVTIPGTASDPPPPGHQPTEAGDLALAKAFTLEAHSTDRTGGPGGRALGAFRQHRFDHMEGQEAGQRPHGDEQCRERGSFVNRTEQRLQRRLVVAYDVREA
jgi:hypothetical protein